MKHFITVLGIICIFIGCSKKDSNEPADPVINLFKALDSKDSMGLIKVLSSTITDAMKTGDTTIRASLNLNKGGHEYVKIKKVVIDSMFPNSAKVYVIQTWTHDTVTRIYDSLFFYVFKEEGQWKLGSLRGARDR
jgi:hypothetical protein